MVVLGSTGSIGVNCLDVISHLDHRLEVVGLSAHSKWEMLLEQVRRWRPRWVAVTDPAAGVPRAGRGDRVRDDGGRGTDPARGRAGPSADPR